MLSQMKKEGNRKDIPTYNAERQLKDSFNVQIQKSKYKRCEL